MYNPARQSRQECPVTTWQLQDAKNRVSAVDAATAQRWGCHSGRLGHESADLLIAATALEHGLTVAIGNVKHFESAGVLVFDPFASETAEPSP